MGRGGASGFEIRFHFCPNCGSNVYWESDRTPEYYGITVGSFADPGFPAPTFYRVLLNLARLSGPALSKIKYLFARV